MEVMVNYHHPTSVIFRIAVAIQRSTVTAMRLCLLSVVFYVALTGGSLAQRHMEALTRGLVAAKHAGGIFVSWRVLATDPEDIGFNLYRTGDDGESVRVNQEPIIGGTNVIDTNPISSIALRYAIRPVLNGKELQVPQIRFPFGRSPI